MSTTTTTYTITLNGKDVVQENEILKNQIKKLKKQINRLKNPKMSKVYPTPKVRQSK